MTDSEKNTPCVTYTCEECGAEDVYDYAFVSKTYDGGYDCDCGEGRMLPVWHRYSARRARKAELWRKGLRSVAAGVSAAQVPEAQAQADRRGLRVRYDPQTGDAIFPDRAARKATCRAIGLVDRDGGFGDCTDLGEDGRAAKRTLDSQLADGIRSKMKLLFGEDA